jgi:SAM-dependent methyltransferase
VDGERDGEPDDSASMNPGLTSDHASIRFYDGDYPSTHTPVFPENCDSTLAFQGLANDIDRYLELAAETGGPILDLCCGTGRITIPLARAGHECTGVDVNAGMLERMRANLSRESEEVRRRVTISEQNVSTLNLVPKDFRLVICAFNSLLCIPSFEGQRAALRAMASHLDRVGLLALDVVNPLDLSLNGDPAPKPFFTRRNPASGAIYTRFAASDPIDAEQRQRLHGWYDEIADDNTLRRYSYSLTWRPIFRFELELLLELAGLQLVSLEGGHLKEPFEASSPRMFVVARQVRSAQESDRFEAARV